MMMRLFLINGCILISYYLWNNACVSLDGPQKSKTPMDRSHETYRLLRRKNLIVEMVHGVKIVEGLYPSVPFFKYLYRF